MAIHADVLKRGPDIIEEVLCEILHSFAVNQRPGVDIGFRFVSPVPRRVIASGDLIGRREQKSPPPALQDEPTNGKADPRMPGLRLV